MNDIFVLPLTNSDLLCLISSEDINAVMYHKCWRVDNHGYIVTDGYGRFGPTILLHNLIIGRKRIDHKNRFKWDNRRSNLRKCTKSQNQANSKIYSTNTTGYKGVSLFRGKLFRARVFFHGKEVYLGMFESAIDAARAYNIKAKELFGEFALLNNLSDDTNPINKLV